ncbi:MAG: flavodoxin family protein [Candidatus Riflebacteria bacterium]|nr:flavodoxin family protein [Candidatus Riflebacteria bacterium]
MTIKAIAISGSPRAEGNTQTLLKRCLGHLQTADVEVTYRSVGSELVKPCIACGKCSQMKNRTCAIRDDAFHPIFNEMVEADIIIVGSPVYFGSATPNLMALLDRAGYVGRANGHLFSRKIGGPVVVARRAGQNFTFAQLLFWFMINDMVVPGSSYWNVTFGRAPGEVTADEEGIQTVDRFAENLLWLAQKLHS